MRAVLASVLAGLLAVGGGCGDDGPDPVAPVRTDDPVAKFAPVIRFDADERYLPISSPKLIDRATLKWANDGCGLDTIATGKIARRKTPDPAVPDLTPDRLAGARPYGHHPLRPDCVTRRETVWTTTDPTRPYELADRPDGLPLPEGFYLDFLSDSYGGDVREGRARRGSVISDAQTYFERRPARIDGEPGLRISYWFLFAYTSLPGDGLESEALSHEGDWERLDVLLRRGPGPRRYVPVALRFHTYGNVREVPWEDVESYGARTLGRDLLPRRERPTHPIVYSALGTHTLHPRPGTYRTAVRTGGRRLTLTERVPPCRRCRSWRTVECLDELVKQPWYGYRGGWGLRYRADASSGPAGPMPPSE